MPKLFQYKNNSINNTIGYSYTVVHNKKYALVHAICCQSLSSIDYSFCIFLLMMMMMKHMH